MRPVLEQWLRSGRAATWSLLTDPNFCSEDDTRTYLLALHARAVAIGRRRWAPDWDKASGEETFSHSVASRAALRQPEQQRRWN